MKIAVTTLGCKVNQTESEGIAELLTEKGHRIVDFSEQAEVYLIHSCCVTKEAERKTRQLVRRANRQSPAARIGVFGCYAQLNGAELAKLPGVEWVVGTFNRARLAELLLLPAAMETQEPAQPGFEELPLAAKGLRTRANIKIQDGCNHFCSYCIIPFVRGRERTRSPEETLAEARRLAEAGYKELVFNGIRLSAVGASQLLSLCAQAAQIPGIARIRLGSLEPALLTESFAREAALNKKLCPQFHISLQSGADTVLERMRRGYTAADFLQGIGHLRRYYGNPALSCDIIAGFPEETQEEFLQTLQLIKGAVLAGLHVFPYSARPGTRAAALPDLPKRLKEERAALLAAAGRESARQYRAQFIGQTAEVLCEEYENGEQTGLTPQHIPVCFPTPCSLQNRLVRVKLHGVLPGGLSGALVT